MGEYVCESCGCVDLVELLPNPGEHICSECRTGTWHGLFPKRPYNPRIDLVVNRPSGVGLED